MVIPIPETSRTACLPLAYDLGVKYREGFMKNRYVARTFIMPRQRERKRSVRRKLNAIGLEFEGKNVLLVDDSIVRGTTSRQIIQQARDAGARRVYFASAAPPVRYQNVYGIDMPVASELVAFNRTESDVARAIGADRLIYQSLDGLIGAVRRGNPKLSGFDTSCFTGEYVTGGVSQSYTRNPCGEPFGRGAQLGDRTPPKTWWSCAAAHDPAAARRPPIPARGSAHDPGSFHPGVASRCRHSPLSPPGEGPGVRGGGRGFPAGGPPAILPSPLTPDSSPPRERGFASRQRESDVANDSGRMIRRGIRAIFQPSADLMLQLAGAL